MATAWFICLYKRLPHEQPTRYCAMDDYTALIRADGGDWQEVEVLGNQAIVKVRANVATLTTIAADANITRLPLSSLNDSLSTLTNAQRNIIKQRLLDAGYTASEVNARFPNLSSATLGDVLRFFATRRRKARYDRLADAIVLDGIVVTCGDVDELNTRVS